MVVRVSTRGIRIYCSLDDGNVVIIILGTLLLETLGGLASL
jgi:hypothetical protein